MPQENIPAEQKNFITIGENLQIFTQSTTEDEIID
jgi:hypothetical protein